MFKRLAGLVFGKAFIFSELSAFSRRLDHILRYIKEIDYDDLFEEDYLIIQRQVEEIFVFARRRTKRYPDDLRSKELYFRAVLAKLGGEVNPKVFTDPSYAHFIQFIESNALHHKLQTLKIKMRGDEGHSPLLPIHIEGVGVRHLSWKSLSRAPLMEGGKHRGYIYSYFDVEVFRTNLRFKLVDDYILTYQGITRHHPHEMEAIIAFNKQDPREWGYQYMVEVWTALKDTRGERPTIGIGDHCHILLKDPEGHVYSMGKFGGGRKFKMGDYATLFGPKGGRFISPDFFSYYSETSRNLKKTQIIVSEREFRAIYSQLSADKREKAPVFTLLKHNCAHYVQRVLQKVLKLDIDSELFLPHYFLRVILPRRWYLALVKMIRSTLKKCPSWLQKALYFIPLLYIPMVLVGLAIRLLAFGSHKGHKQADFTMKDIFICPWNLTIYHPLALRESLQAGRRNTPYLS